MSKIDKIADGIMALTHAELVEMADELVNMQKGAKADGWAWKPDKLHGKNGLISMLHAWAESKV